MTKNHFERASQIITLINFAPGRAGMKACAFEKSIIDKILHICGVERAQSELALRFVFAPIQEQISALLYGPLKSECCAWLGRIPNPTNGQVSGLVRQTIFSKIDASSGYWPFNIDDWNKYISTGILHHRLYRLLRMSSCPKNTVSMFKQGMVTILSTGKLQFCTLLSGRCCHFLAVRWRTPEALIQYHSREPLYYWKWWKATFLETEWTISVKPFSQANLKYFQ